MRPCVLGVNSFHMSAQHHTVGDFNVMSYVIGQGTLSGVTVSTDRKWGIMQVPRSKGEEAPFAIIQFGARGKYRQTMPIVMYDNENKSVWCCLTDPVECITVPVAQSDVQMWNTVRNRILQTQ